MNRRNITMTKRLQQVLSDERYTNPRLFTTTIYREDGRMIPEPGQEKLTEEEYFAQFIPPDQAADLSRRLRIAEAPINNDPLTKRREREQLSNSRSPSGQRGRIEDGPGEWLHQRNWKTQPPPKR